MNNQSNLGFNEEYDREFFKTMRFAFVSMFVVILFLFAAANSWAEIKFTLSGVETDARFVRTWTVKGNRDPDTRYIKYRFLAGDGNFYNKIREVDLEAWITPANRTLAVTYLPNQPGVSILTSERTRFWIYIFLILLLMPTIWCIWAWRHAVQGKL